MRKVTRNCNSNTDNKVNADNAEDDNEQDDKDIGGSTASLALVVVHGLVLLCIHFRLGMVATEYKGSVVLSGFVLETVFETTDNKFP